MGLDDWDVSSVTNMGSMFNSAAYSPTAFHLDLSSWDVSSVQNMGGMFYNAGWFSSDWSIGDLSRWDVSSVTNMSQMFYRYSGDIAKNWSIGDISVWDTSNVTNMYQMFRFAGYNSTVLHLDLSGGNVDKVTDRKSVV